VTTGEAAELLGVTRRAVYTTVATGRLPMVEHGGRRFCRRHHVEVIANAGESLLGHRHGR